MAQQVQEDAQLEYDNLRIKYIFPVNRLSKSKLKQLKIPSRDREGCQLVCSACSRGLRSLHAAHSHASNESHKTKVKEKWLDLLLPDLPPPPLAPHHLQALDHFVESSFREQSASVQGQGEVRAGIATELQGLVQQTFPDVTVELFGSSVSGLALVSSNVNLNLSIPGAQDKQVLIPPVMKGVLEIIRCNTEAYSEVKDDFFAFNKIPRILFVHKASGLKCEIRAVVGNPMALSRLLGLYGTLDERALKLAVLFRHWAKVCKVDQQEDGHYPGHMFVVMVIHYLQQRKPQVLPVLHELKAPAETSDSTDSSDKRLDPTAVRYLDDRSEILEKWQCCNTETVGELWYGLLRYYTLEFKMSEHAITIRQLDPLLRSERQWGGARLTVEDPLIPRSNLGRAASSEKVYSYMWSSLKQTLLYFGNPTPADLFSKDNISRLLAQQGELTEEKTKSSTQAEVHDVSENDALPKIPDATTPAEAEATSHRKTQLVGQKGIESEAICLSKPDIIEVNAQQSNVEGIMQQAACDASVLSSKSVKGCTDSTELEAQEQQSSIHVRSSTPETSLNRLAMTEKSESSITSPSEAETMSPHETQLRGTGGEAVHLSKPDGIEVNNSQESIVEGTMQQAACDANVLSSKSVKGCTDSTELEAQEQQSSIHVRSSTPETPLNKLAATEKSESSIDTTSPAEAETVSPHETQLVALRGTGGEAVHLSKPDDIEVNNSKESNVEGQMQQAAWDASVLSSKSVKGCTDSTELEAQEQQSAVHVKSSTPETSLNKLAATEKSESSIDATSPAEAETVSPQLVDLRRIGGEAVHSSKPDIIEVNNSEKSNVEGKMQQGASDARVLSSKSVKGCTDSGGLDAHAQQNAVQVSPNTTESSMQRLAAKDAKEKSESGTENDNSIVFAAFSQKECPAVAANTEPNEFEVSFFNDSQLAEQPDDHQKVDLKHKPQVPAQEQLPSDVKFGSFSDDGEGEKAGGESENLVPTEQQRHAQQNMNDETNPQPLPSLHEKVNRSLHKDSVDSSLQMKSVDSSLCMQSTCVNHETVDSSDTKMSGREERVSMAPELTSTSQSAEGAESSRGVISTLKPILSDPLLPTTATTSYSFHISNFVFQPYPKACLNCRKLNHSAVQCPTDDLPELMKLMPRYGPGQPSLRTMESAFKTHMNGVIPRASNFRMRETMCDYILADIKKIYPNARLQLFGSSANGFGSFKSDLDICMTLEGDAQFESSSVIQAVAEVLYRHKEKYQYILPITHARVPIVKFYLCKWRLQCDISLENQLALRNTQMLAAYASIDQRVQILGYALKHMAKVCDMGDASTGSLSSYAYILLLLHYLQRTHPPVVPVLQEIFPSDTGRRAGPYIHSWNCYYYEFQSKEDLIKVWPHYHKNMLPVGELWLGFLRYFLRFDWETKVVAVRQMDPVTKFDKWWMSKCMCIEDPFNLEHNLAAGISGKMRTYILERFAAALSYHSEDILWACMDHMMDEEALIGESRSPKFIVCILCNGRGHKAQQCPFKNKKPKPRNVPAKQDNEKNTKEAAGSTISPPPMVAQTSKPSGGILRIPLKSKGDPSKKSEQLPKRKDVNKEFRNSKKRQKRALVEQEPHPQNVSNIYSSTVACDPFVTPHSSHSSAITPQSGYSSVITPQSGYSSAITPQSGQSSATTPQSGHTSATTPHSAHTSVITPHSAHSSVIAPHSSHASVITPHRGHPSNAFRFSPQPSVPITSRLPPQAVYTRSPFPDPHHATPFGPFPHSASPTTPTGPWSPHAHPSAFQDWRSPAFSPLQPTQQMTNTDFGFRQSLPSPHIQAQQAQEFQQYLYQGHSVPSPGAGSPSPFQHPTPTYTSHGAGNRRSHGDHDRHANARHSNTGQRYPK